jgi:hypothetical protein
MENDIKTDMKTYIKTNVKTQVKTEDLKSKLVVAPWAELDLFRTSLWELLEVWNVLSDEESRKLECALYGLENLLSRRDCKSSCASSLSPIR